MTDEGVFGLGYDSTDPQPFVRPVEEGANPYCVADLAIACWAETMTRCYR